jgi:RNA-binding protein NOB1
MASEAPQKPIHSLILDTGPLIKNAVSISTIINSAEEIFTTPAIISEIRDAATRSRVQTTLMPFLKVRNPSQASFDAVIAFSKKTGDYAVLSRQDLGILALAYEVHCERNGGPWGLRDAPKGPLKLKPGEETTADDETKEHATEDSERTKVQEKIAAKPMKAAKKQPSEHAKVQAEGQTEEQAAEDEGFEVVKQKKGKRNDGRKQKGAHAKKNNGGKATISEVTEQVKPEQDQVEEQSDSFAPGEVEQTLEDAPRQNQPQGEPTKQVPTQDPSEGGAAISEAQQSAQTSLQETTEGGVSVAETQSSAEPEQAEASLATQTTENHLPISDNAEAQDEAQMMESESQEEGDVDASYSAHTTHTVDELATLEQLKEAQHPRLAKPHQPESHPDLSILNIDTPPSPPFTDSDSDGDGDWITPTNLTDRQAKDSGLISNSRTDVAQMDVATMTIDFAMQNVLLQMNLHLLSTNMQRIKNLTSKVLRCHACFTICRDMSKQFCPSCGGASLLRVNCSTNAKGEFRLHLAKNYTYNKRGDRYSVPKPIAGTANGKWNGLGGGQGGWGRDLVLSEDQKERTKAVEEERRSKGARDLMDDDYLPGILTGDRSGRAGGRMKVGAGKNVNSKKRT